MKTPSFSLPISTRLYHQQLRLAAIFCLCVLCALTLISTLFFWQQRSAALRQEVQILASNLGDHLITGDLRAIQNQTLNASNYSHWESVTVVGREGKTVVAWANGNLIAPETVRLTSVMNGLRLRQTFSVQVLQTPITDSGGLRGQLRVEVSMLPVWQFAGILFLAGLLFAGLLGWLLVRWMVAQQLKLLQPLEEVVTTLEQVNSLSNYSLRVTPDRERLFGALQTSLNLMLARMESWETDTHSALREQRAEENRLAILENHDSLTKLPNRHYFHKLITNSVEQAIDTGEMLALMFIDLDQFRQITDEHGFETGDLVLRAIAERLREVLRNTDTLCRVSADEFAAILPNIQDLDTVRQLAERLLLAIRKPLILQGRSLMVTGSIGIACCPLHAVEQRLFLRNADLALQSAKAAGRNHWSLFDPNLHTPSGTTLPKTP